MKTCSKCGAQCNDEFVFCTACGAKFETEQSMQLETSANNQAEEAAPSLMQTEDINGASMQPAADNPAPTGKANTPVRPDTDPVEQAPAFVREEPVLIKCEFCGEMVYSNEKACKNFGAQLNYSKQASIEEVTGEFISSNIKKIKKASTAGFEKIKKAVTSVDGNKAKQLMEQNKKYLPVAAAALVFIILLLVLVPRMAKSPVVSTYGSNQLSYYSTDDEMIFYNNRRVVAKIEDAGTTPVLSMDGSKAAILADYSRGDGGSLYLIDSKGEKHETNKITGRNYKALITNDMKKLVYLDYSECLHIVTKLNSKNPKDVELDASDDVVNFTISEDGKTIYYVNEDDELYSITTSNRPYKIADDVAKYNLVTLGNKVYFLTDYYDTGALYYTTGKRKTAVRNADEVSYAYRLGNGLVYQEGDYDERIIYGSSNGKSFRKLFSAD